MTYEETINAIQLDGIEIIATLARMYSFSEGLKKAEEVLKRAEKYRWHDLRKDPNDLPTERGGDGSVPKTYEMVIERICGETRVRVQGSGWLNDIWGDCGTGFLMIANQLTSVKLTTYPDVPIKFYYDELIAWREKEPFEEEE